MKKIALSILMLSLFALAGGCIKVNIVPEVEPLMEKTIAGKGRDKVLVLRSGSAQPSTWSGRS